MKKMVHSFALLAVVLGLLRTFAEFGRVGPNRSVVAVAFSADGAMVARGDEQPVSFLLMCAALATARHRRPP